MPFKSEAQRRFFHAATEPGFRGNADISKKDVAKWERETPKGKKLPEHVSKKASFLRTARQLGRHHAMKKQAGVVDRLINAAGQYAGWWVPAVGGAYLAGPGYRTEGALAGLAAGRLGAGLGRRQFLKTLEGGEKYFAGKGPAEFAEVARQLGRGRGAALGQLGLITPEKVLEAQRALGHWGLAGGALGGAAAGYGAGRLLGAQNPYGMQPVFPGMGRENPMGLRPE